MKPAIETGSSIFGGNLPEFLRKGAFALLCLCWTLACFGLPKAKGQPNVVLILADDMATGDISYFNGGLSRTPHLDRLIDESVWFNQAYSASPVCGPARAALLTGRYPHRTGVVTLDMQKYPSMTRLKLDEVTLADAFRESGYVTGLIGKWHLGMGKQWHPLERGFAEFEGFYDHTTTAYFEYDLDVGGEVAHFDSDYLTQDLSKRAIDFVRRHRAEPFFLHLAHYAPHRPLEAPRALVQSYLDRGLEANTATIYAMIEIMDQGIGELVDELDALGLRDDTIIIFASDNGPDPLTGERFNFGVRGTKYQIYEGGIRVPFLISWRNPLKSRTEDAIVHFSDVFPTLVDLCDLAAPTGYQLDGQSLTELLKEGGKLAGIQRFWQWNRGAPNYTHNATMRKGDWKLVRPYVTRSDDPSDSAEPAALYNLKTDPMETTNLAATHRERYSDMKEKLEAWSKEVEQSRLR